jgi:ABC-type nickel/cobalt efflux system permease component RcnA
MRFAIIAMCVWLLVVTLIGLALARTEYWPQAALIAGIPVGIWYFLRSFRDEREFYAEHAGDAKADASRAL